MRFYEYRLWAFVIVVLLGLGDASIVQAWQAKTEIPGLEEFSKSAEKEKGFFPIWKSKLPSAKLWIEIPLDQGEFLFSYGLATGLGSNPIGLDRGKLGDQHVVEFRLVGNRVMMIEKNLRFRASSKNPLERKAVTESFAGSILWSQKVAALGQKSVIVEVSSLMNKDWNGVAKALASTGGGSFKLDKDRCFLYGPRTKAFPHNTELESWQTYQGDRPGSDVRQTAPSGNSVSLRSHLSFVKLPDSGYQPRVADIRSPSMSIVFSDYSAPIEAALENRWIMRHRLKKKDPNAKVSEAVEPIVYYVDSGAPKEIQDALIDGASWWNEAFSEIGFKDAFVVKPMPEGMDPMDCRYNVIQWVHRSTRGWSYGGSVIDPRTGEIIKGHVSLGSLRVRQDRLIFEGLTNPFQGAGKGDARKNERNQCAGGESLGSEFSLASFDPGTSPKEVALARIRQLSAHEVGHTLGFVHNFAGSTYGDRASVMDYPAPRVGLKQGKIDLSDAYGVGIGSWDKVGVAYAYSDFPPGTDEKKQLAAIIKNSLDKKMLFLSDGEARPDWASDPAANLWDNGTDPVKELRHLLKVRNLALKEFGLDCLPEGRPVSELEEVFVPIYLLHRYQIDATAKVVGGVRFRFAVKGDLQKPTEAVSPKEQKDALIALMEVLQPKNLAVNAQTAALFAPARNSSIRQGETFTRNTSPTFDRLAAAEVIVDMVLSKLLNARRLNRLADQGKPGSEFNLGQFVEITFRELKKSYSSPADLHSLRLSMMIQRRLFHHVTKLYESKVADPVVHGAAGMMLDRVYRFPIGFKQMPKAVGQNDLAPFLSEKILLQSDILRYRKRNWGEKTEGARKATAPAGSPIGS